MSDIDKALRDAMHRAAQQGDPTGVAARIHQRVAAGDPGAAAQTLPGWGISRWWAGLGVVAVVGVVAGVLGAAGVFGRPAGPVTAPNIAAMPAGVVAPASCPNGTPADAIPGGTRVLLLARDESATAVAIRDPRHLSRTVWLSVSDVVPDAGQPAIADLPVGTACARVERVLVDPRPETSTSPTGPTTGAPVSITTSVTTLPTSATSGSTTTAPPTSTSSPTSTAAPTQRPTATSTPPRTTPASATTTPPNPTTASTSAVVTSTHPTAPSPTPTTKPAPTSSSTQPQPTSSQSTTPPPSSTVPTTTAPPADHTPPVVDSIAARSTLSQSAQWAYDDEPIVVTVHAHDNLAVTQVKLTWSGALAGSATMTKNSSGAWVYTVQPDPQDPAGTVVFSAVAKDAAGNSSSAVTVAISHERLG